jgi:chaperonin GroES
MMKVTPLQDRILVKRVESAGMTKSGLLHIPDSAKEKPAEGTVVSVGAGKINSDGDRVAMTLKAKDKVLFSSYAGSEIKLDGQDYLIMGEDEVLAVID